MPSTHIVYKLIETLVDMDMKMHGYGYNQSLLPTFSFFLMVNCGQRKGFQAKSSLTLVRLHYREEGDRIPLEQDPYSFLPILLYNV